MGVAGAGKSRIGSAVAASLGVLFIEGDDFHPPGNVAQMASGNPLTDEDRRGWLLSLAGQLRTARRQGRGVVLACSALKRQYRDTLRTADAAIRFIVLSGDAALLRERLDARAGHYMPSSLLDSQLSTLELPGDDEQAWTFDVRQPPETIVATIVARLQAVPAVPLE
jgi:gluconokinase